jgi:hypothetical protein
VVAALTTEADAATVTLNSVSGVWTSTDPEAGVSGVGTNEIRWGFPLSSSRSGYKFEGVTNGGTFDIGQVFTAGTFTHFNQPIDFASPVLTAGTLEVNFDVSIANGTPQNLRLSSVFNFDHLETDNSDNPCVNGGANNTGINVNGCADRVRLTTNVGASDTVIIDGVPHLLTLTGFVVDGDPAAELWTIEGRNNTAELTGALTAQSTVVPVPAALPLLLTALAGLGVAGYRARQVG